MRITIFVLTIVAAGCSGAGVRTRSEPSECEVCIASGRNWTGNTCADGCLQDTWCYGPDNASAQTCPLDAR